MAVLRLAYPALFAAGAVIGMLTVTAAPAADALRPLVVVVGVVVALQFAFTAISRRADLSAFVALGVLAAGLELIALLGWLAAMLLWAMLDVRTAGRPLVIRPRTEALAVLGACLLLVTIGYGVMNGTFGLDTSAAPPHHDAPGVGPDVWLLLLDGYPRSDTLAADYGIDNKPFLEALRERGFDIPTNSQSNYSLTAITLATMLHLAHVPDIPILAGLEAADGATQKRALKRALDGSPMQEILSRHGYEFVTVPPTTIDVTTADRNFRSDGLKPFEIYLLEETLIGRTIIEVLPHLVPGQHRHQLLEAWTRLEELAGEQAPGPRFIFGHILAPHAPFVFAADGSPIPQLCFPRCAFYQIHEDQMGVSREEYGAALAGQVAWVNAQTIDLVDAILAGADEPPVVVVWSDHGTRSRLTGSREEWFRTLFAAFTPGHSELFGDSPAVINIMPTLARAYFAESHGNLPTTKYLSRDGTYPLRLDDLTASGHSSFRAFSPSSLAR